MAEALGPGIARPSLASGPYACSTYYLQVTTYYLLPTTTYYTCVACVSAVSESCRPASTRKLPLYQLAWPPCGHKGGCFAKGRSSPKSWKLCFAGCHAGTGGGALEKVCPVQKVGNGAVLATVRAHGAALEKVCDVWYVRPHKLETVLCWPPCGHKGRALKIVCPVQKVGNCALLATMQAQGALWKRYVLCPATYFTIRTRPAAGAVAKGSLLASRCFLNSLRLQLLVTGVVAPPLV